jgi:hypothetical protein
LDDGAVLGLLDDYVPRSGYVITPVACWGVIERAGPDDDDDGPLTAAEAS